MLFTTQHKQASHPHQNKLLQSSILEYAGTVWSKKRQRDTTLSKIFKDGQQYLLNNYSQYASITEMLPNLNWPTLTRCRNEHKATMLFKIITHQIDINADNLLIPNPDIYHIRGRSKRFMLPMTQKNSYKYSFFPSTIKIWNSLPQHMIDLTEIEQFKHNLAGLEQWHIYTRAYPGICPGISSPCPGIRKSSGVAATHKGHT